ncbi:septum formation inhibitor Maf [Tenacibaculum sp. 190524A05c]|uniref:septum formation inhibitor Maf n=1 Tax=Tenacibaculum platacis TaxID=3137852 RepID=UPI0031FA7D2F
MKLNNTFHFTLILTTIIISFSSLVSCKKGNALEVEHKKTKSSDTFPSRKVNQDLKNYWFDGTAEISTYELNQVRYGEVHKGKATLIFVTEPFSKASNTKADYTNDNNIPVLKLNSTKKFNTGIYPYSLMNSTFFPFENTSTSLKISSSIQEWCGMTYLEMKNENDLIFNFNSYFESASFKNKKLTNSILEDDLWSLLRLNPELLPKGNFSIIPSMFYLTLTHKEVKSFSAITSLETNSTKAINTYTIHYPELNRTLQIEFSAKPPYQISSWKETYLSGYGNQRKKLTTEAKLIKSLKIDYWNKNKTSDIHLRDSLGI